MTGVLIGTISSRETATTREARFKRFACLDAIDKIACVARQSLLCNIPVGRQSRGKGWTDSHDQKEPDRGNPWSDSAHE